MLTQSRLQHILHYDPITGVFTWKIARGRYAGIKSVAGYTNSNGYCLISVDGKRLRAHRLAWLYVFGRWPVADIDHVNGDRADNRFANLREATRSQNLANKDKSRNNRSGVKGVHVHYDGRFRAQIRKDGQKFHLGVFATAEQAHAAYRQKAVELFGSFARVR